MIAAVTGMYTEQLPVNQLPRKQEDHMRKFLRHTWKVALAAALVFALVFDVAALSLNKGPLKSGTISKMVSAVNDNADEQSAGAPYYTVNTDTDLTIDEKGKIITFNDEDINYIASVSGQKVTLRNAIYSGHTYGFMFGQYRNTKNNFYNTDVYNVSLLGLDVSNGVVNGKDRISNGVYVYGNTVLNNCTMVGTTSSAEGYQVHDIGFTNCSNSTINGGQYGSVYVWSQAHVAIYDAEIDTITSAAITTRNLGMLTIGKGTHVGTIDLTVGGYSQYSPALTIEKGAVVDEIIYKGVSYTQREWDNPFEGLTISVMGDSISTYTGWSDANPITSEDCEYRYGEAYYGPEGGDFHNTDLLVEDTWWHQAATELEAEILVSNAGNSTGLLHASYPANAQWQQYLQDMLAYKSRPYYLGTEEQDPDIIALYIGSNDMAKVPVSQFGSVDAVNFDTLIVENEDGTYTYAEPVTVAEAYCILLHKISVTYPDAEVYCFTTVPNSGGYLSTVNKRLVSTVPFNEMVKGVAAYHGAHVVDLLEHFQLDPDGDGVAVQEDFERFQTYFNGDPHPNAAGFDMITECFVSAVWENSKYAN